MIIDEKALSAAFYSSISANLKERIRPFYPEIDTWAEADAIELCLAFNRAQRDIRVREDFEDRKARHDASLRGVSLDT